MASCHHVYYAPNTTNAPLLSEKGETRINALYSSGNTSEFNGGELQFAHAVSKHMGIMVNGFIAGKSEEISDWNWNQNSSHKEKGSGSNVEFAGGYFKSFDERKKWIGELYGGFGLGSVTNEYGYGDRSKVNSTKIFLQPSIGYKLKNFEFAVVPKVSLINWRIKENRISSSENESAKDEMKAIGQKQNFIAFEPALLVRGGGENFKLQLGLSFSDYKSASTYYTESLIETLNASIGISINLKPIKK